MVDQTIAKPLGLIKDLKIFVHGIPYIVTFIVINSNVLDSSYSMLFKHPWLKDAKVSHNWGTIKGTDTVKNHTYYQETWYSNQKTKSLYLL
jgi:hypothetical protein